MIQRMTRLLSRPSTLVTLVAASYLAADLVLIFVIGPIDFAFDFSCCYQQAGERVITDPSTLYAWSDTYTFRYTPLGALLFVPLVPLSEDAAAWAWVGIKLVVLGVTAVWYARPWNGVDRWLVLLAVVAFPPIVHDLVLGNVSTITVLVLLAVARWPDTRGGVALGLLLALMPKPHLIPVLVYLAFRQRRAFAASLPRSPWRSSLASRSSGSSRGWRLPRRSASRSSGRSRRTSASRRCWAHRGPRGRRGGRSDLRSRRARPAALGLRAQHRRRHRRRPVHVHPLPRGDDRGGGTRPRTRPGGSRPSRACSW